MTTRRARKTLLRAYTIVELVMSLSVLGIGVSGILAMQRVTVSGNRHAKNLAIATRIAEAWADELAADATLWTLVNGTSTLVNTTWLKDADPSATVGWIIPAYSATRSFGPGFNALGDVVDHKSLPKLVRFCTHVRYAFVRDEKDVAGNLRGNGAIRAQVRVFWRREDAASVMDGTALPGGDALCTVDGPTFTTNLDAFHVVYLTTVVRQAGKGLL